MLAVETQSRPLEIARQAEEGSPRLYSPVVPETVQNLGIPKSLVVDLILRRVHIDGTSTLESLSHALKLSPTVIESVFREMRQQQLLDVKGMLGNDYSFSLTAAGRSAAQDRFLVSKYAGPAPVSIRQYHEAALAQAARVNLNRQSLADALSDLVVSDHLLDQLGPALISHSSLFLYGPTGNGKTSLAERLLRVYRDLILVPYAVEVDGNVIVLFDPVVHRQVEVEEDPALDPRWVVCERPCITVGGELVPAMLELRLDESSGTYAAPLQMKANNGIFLIDDFGRQVMSPRELLNRWIVPLDRRVDYLTLRHGIKFQIPFELLVVFSTNLDPNDLADQAFLRRIRNKVFVQSVDAQAFDQIFERVVDRRNIPCEPDSAAYLRGLCMRYVGPDLRACYPADICTLVGSISEYENRPVRISKSDLDRAAALYFPQPRTAADQSNSAGLR